MVIPMGITITYIVYHVFPISSKGLVVRRNLVFVVKINVSGHFLCSTLSTDFTCFPLLYPQNTLLKTDNIFSLVTNSHHHITDKGCYQINEVLGRCV